MQLERTNQTSKVSNVWIRASLFSGLGDHGVVMICRPPSVFLYFLPCLICSVYLTWTYQHALTRRLHFFMLGCGHLSLSPVKQTILCTTCSSPTSARCGSCEGLKRALTLQLGGAQAFLKPLHLVLQEADMPHHVLWWVYLHWNVSWRGWGWHRLVQLLL